MKLFTDSGYLNVPEIIGAGYTFNIILSGRGVGKTFGFLKWLRDQAAADQGRFGYLRRLQTQIDICGKAEFNPFKRLDSVYHMTTTVKSISKYSSGFYDGDLKLLGYGLALSTFGSLRGFDGSDIDYILFEECIPKIGEHRLKQEAALLWDAYETINRNRELEGKTAVKCIMLGNANKISNPYFTGWHCMRRVLRMIQGKQFVWRSDDRTRMIILLLESPVSARKADTVLYKNANQDFISMALDNAFRTDETKIKSEPLKEFTHIVSVGEIGIYKHKTERRYYVSSTVGQPFYEAFGIGLKMFQLDYYMLRVYYMVNKKYFSLEPQGFFGGAFS